MQSGCRFEVVMPWIDDSDKPCDSIAKDASVA